MLDEEAPFVAARPLAPGEDEAYLLPERTAERETVYEHCCRAIDRSLAVGAHGLPLMGTGDWNDGMNRVGREGRGESVWMGLFLADCWMRSLPSARRAASPSVRPVPRASRRHLRRARACGAGTGSGTGAPTTTTARRSARPRATSAGSTRSRRPGP